MTKKPDVIPTPTDPTQTFGMFKNANGEVFVIHGLSPMLPQKIREDIAAQWKSEKKDLPVCPTYEIIIAPEGKEIAREIHEHDATTLIVEGDLKQTKINQDNWREYSQKLSEFEGEYSSRLMKKVFLAVDIEPDDKWREEMEFTGTTLPTKGSAAEKYLYVEQRVVQSVDDIADLMTDVLSMAGIIKPEAVETARAAFRSMLEKAISETGKPESKVEQLESDGVLLGSGDGALLEPAPVIPGVV